MKDESDPAESGEQGLPDGSSPEQATLEASRHITAGHLASGAALKQVLLAATHPDKESDRDDVLEPMEKAINHHRQALRSLERIRQRHVPDEVTASKEHESNSS